MAKEDLFDRFRDKSEELELPPSPPTWGRIERRMQVARPPIRRARVRRLPGPLSIAASLALLLGLSVTFMWLTEQDANETMAYNTESTFVLEELPLNVDELAAPSVELIHTHIKTTPKKPINEGRASQRLIARTEAPQERNTAPSTSVVDSTQRRTGR